MFKRTFATFTSVLLLTAVLGAQETKPVPATSEKPAPRPEAANEPDIANLTNVKLDFTITDTGTGQPGKRTVAMIVAAGRQGMIRTGGHVLVSGTQYKVTLNVDARPTVLPDNRVLVQLALEYVPKPAGDAAPSGEGRANVNQQLTTVVTPGKPTVVSQASDPTSDRRVTVELTATILK